MNTFYSTHAKLIACLALCLTFTIPVFSQSVILRDNLSSVLLDSTNPQPPAITVTVNTTPSPGAIFLANFGWGQAAVDPHLLILNNDGSIIQQKYLPGTSGTGFRMQPNGTLSYYSETEQKYYILDSNLNTIKTVGTTNGYQTDNHELLFLPNGHYILLALTHRQQDMSPITPGGSELATIVGNTIQEYDENGNLIFEWLSDQHFQITDATHEDLTTDRIDYCHANAVEVDHDDNLLLSSRHLDEITKINRTTGEIIWRWGGKHNQFTFINDTLGFSHQHSIRVLPNGHYVLFDNGNFHTPPASRVCEYIVDEVAMTATLVREYRHTPDLFSLAMGSIQYLENGNWLISWGANTKVALTEVTPTNETVLEMAMTGGNVSYRAYKYPWQKPMTSVHNESAISLMKVSVFPNPASSIANLSFHMEKTSDVSISLIDELGRTIFTKDHLQCSQGYTTASIDVSHINNGVYTVRLTTESTVSYSKLVIK